MTPITDRDRANARLRRQIAERQARAYAQVLALAEAAFGPGWLPSARHYLVDHDEEDRARRTGDRPQAAATVYTVKNAAGDQRHFTVDSGQVVEHANYQDGFGSMLLEPHPTRGFTHRGQWCPTHRYSLCWAPYELYEPKSAEGLAELRASRERKKAERADKRWAEAYPLLAQAEKAQQTPPEEKGRSR
jgi:hypothetical protein